VITEKKLLATVSQLLMSTILQALLNKKEKEQLVIQLYHEGKTVRDIASAAHVSFSEIGRIVKKLDGSTSDENDINLSNKSKATQAMNLFKSGKKPIEVAIELDISAREIEDILQEYWVLIGLDELALVYYEIRNYLDLFLKLYHALKKNKSITQKDIGRLLKYAVYDLPTLENKIQTLTSDAIDMEWRKKRLRDEVVKLSSCTQYLRKSLYWYEMEIKEKKEIISNLDRQLSQKSDVLEKLAALPNK
jgi:hypothetical protein